MIDLTEQELAGLIGSLSPAPDSWIKATKELPPGGMEEDHAGDVPETETHSFRGATPSTEADIG
jgi:hypothetical protein